MSQEKIARYPQSENIPLSIAQKRIWVMEQLASDLPFSNRPLAIRMKGELDKKILIQSLSKILERHEALRTVFPVQDGQPFQRILPKWTLTPEIIDLGAFPEPQREVQAGEILKREAQKKFDLINGPLIKSLLVRLSDQNHILLLLIHHIIFDGWSENILLDELKSIYRAFLQTRNGGAAPDRHIELPELPFQYTDFTLWQHTRVNEALLTDHLNYWQAKLGKALSPLRLPTDFPRPQKLTFQGQSESILVPQALVESLTTLGHREGVTPFMMVLALWQTLLYRYTGQQIINVGVPVAGRNHSETEHLIGLFMNTLVMSCDFTTDPTFRQLLAQVKQVTLQAFSHQELPFEKIVEVLHPVREKNTWPLFQVVLNFRNLPPPRSHATDSLIIEPFSFECGMIGGLDLSLEIITRPDGMFCQFHYPVELFRGETIRSFAKHFRNLLINATANPDKPVGTLNLLNPEEHHQILVEWNNTHVDYPGTCVHELVERQVKSTPHAVAVVFKEQNLTFTELNQSANQLAHYLTQQGIPPEARIGICVEPSLEMVIGLLGILKAGCAYVPLDPGYPRERLEYMAEDSKISFLVTQGHFRNMFSNYNGGMICLDRDRDLWSSERVDNLQRGCQGESLAYVMYTSGTTGQPKGIMVTHRGACNHLFWRHDYFGLTQSDRVLQKASLSFDDSFWEIFEPLTSGAQLIISQSDYAHNVRYLVDTIIQQKITVLCLVPSLLWLFLEEPNVRQCRTLKRVTTGGEELSVELQEKFFQHLNADLYNGYGPTEGTIAVSYWKCQPEGNSQVVPIGKPISNVQLYVLNPQLQPVPIGVIGEICIGGKSLAKGYLNNPELTREKFISNPFGQGVLYKTGDLGRYSSEGNLEFRGRIDDQVKIRGIRIELGEIKSSLNHYPQIETSEIVTTASDNNDQMIIAYYLSTDDRQIPPQQLREFLKHKLPDYMIPSAFVHLTGMPLTPNGKIDRKALPSPQREHYVNKNLEHPKTDTEQHLTRIWQEVLHHQEAISIHDNFFELGGHSLSAFRVVSRIRDIFKVELPLRSLFESPTLAELTEVLERALSSEHIHK